MKLMDAQLERQADATGLRERIRQRQQQRLMAAFEEFRNQGGAGSVLHVAATTPEKRVGSADAGDAVVSCALDLRPDQSGRERYARGDGRQLLYRDGEFDWVVCDGVLERAGDYARQFDLLKEMNRVARKGLFVTAANRRYPFDLQSGLPLLHWLPTTWWHRVAGAHARGRRLLTAAELVRMASLLPGKHASDVGHVRLAGPKAHLFLMVRKG